MKWHADYGTVHTRIQLTLRYSGQYSGRSYVKACHQMTTGTRRHSARWHTKSCDSEADVVMLDVTGVVMLDVIYWCMDTV